MDQTKVREAMEAFLKKENKTPVEEKIAVRLQNGEKLVTDLSQKHQEAVKQKASYETQILSLNEQMRALWDLVFELEAEAKVKEGE